MNLLLIHPHELDHQRQLTLAATDRRAQHAQQILRTEVGHRLSCGVVGGGLGQAEVLSSNGNGLRLQLDDCTDPPPPPLPITLVLALPRPQMLKRSLQTIATMGVKKLVLVHSARVEKSFWQTPLLAEAAVTEQLLLGLEQARDTALPQVQFERRLKPFVEDQLPALAANTRRLIAHPDGATRCPNGVSEPVTLAIGPEGGWLDYEVTLFADRDFQPVHLGPRILRVETAVPVLLARLCP